MTTNFAWLPNELKALKSIFWLFWYPAIVYFGFVFVANQISFSKKNGKYLSSRSGTSTNELDTADSSLLLLDCKQTGVLFRIWETKFIPVKSLTASQV